jgi:hypothetical protein
MIVQGFLPGIHAVGGPVAVDPPDRQLAMPARLDQHLGKQGGLGIVTVNQDGNLLAAIGKLLICHIINAYLAGIEIF